MAIFGNNSAFGSSLMRGGFSGGPAIMPTNTLTAPSAPNAGPAGNGPAAPAPYAGAMPAQQNMPQGFPQQPGIGLFGGGMMQGQNPMMSGMFGQQFGGGGQFGNGQFPGLDAIRSYFAQRFAQPQMNTRQWPMWPMSGTQQ